MCIRLLYVHKSSDDQIHHSQFTITITITITSPILIRNDSLIPENTEQRRSVEYFVEIS